MVRGTLNWEGEDNSKGITVGKGVPKNSGRGGDATIE